MWGPGGGGEGRRSNMPVGISGRAQIGYSVCPQTMGSVFWSVKVGHLSLCSRELLLPPRPRHPSLSVAPDREDLDGALNHK